MMIRIWRWTCIPANAHWSNGLAAFCGSRNNRQRWCESGDKERSIRCQPRSQDHCNDRCRRFYEHTGDWMYTSGIPAKTGVGGGVMGVLPGQFGIAAFAPPLDGAGNSVKAQLAIQYVMNKLGLNVFSDNHLIVVRLVYPLYEKNKRLLSSGIDTFFYFIKNAFAGFSFLSELIIPPPLLKFNSVYAKN